MTGLYRDVAPLPPRRRRAQLNWLVTVLPGFPLALLVLRLWYLSRQDLPTMLLLVQYISPLGMLSALFITLFWTVPAAILLLRTLGGILLVSAPESAGRSLLAVTALRMPDWVVPIAAVLAAFTWQMRLLPTLAMLIVAILGLTAVQRYPASRWLTPWITLGVPILVGLLMLIFVWPGIVAAIRLGEPTTALMLGVPPLLGPFLTGPVPAWSARLVTHWPAVAVALVAPFVVGAVFLRAAVLPESAVEVAVPGKPIEVRRGQLISVDDTSTALLPAGSDVEFIRNDQVRSRTVCPTPPRQPQSRVSVRGWPVESPALSWMAPTRPPVATDSRCLGRPLG